MKNSLLACSRVGFALVLASIAASAAAQDNDRARQVAAEMQKRFAAADKNGDGRLTKAEAEAGMPYVHKHFDEIDKAEAGLGHAGRHRRLRARAARRAQGNGAVRLAALLAAAGWRAAAVAGDAPAPAPTPDPNAARVAAATATATSSANACAAAFTAPAVPCRHDDRTALEAGHEHEARRPPSPPVAPQPKKRWRRRDREAAHDLASTGRSASARP